MKKTSSYTLLSENNRASAVNKGAIVPAVMLLTTDQQEFYFDAIEALSALEDFMLSFLIEDNFGVGATSDSLVYYYEYTDARIAALLQKALNVDWEQTGDLMGFACYLCPDKTLSWIKENRPHLLKQAS